MFYISLIVFECKKNAENLENILRIKSATERINMICTVLEIIACLLPSLQALTLVIKDKQQPYEHFMWRTRSAKNAVP